MKTFILGVRLHSIISIKKINSMLEQRTKSKSVLLLKILSIFTIKNLFMYISMFDYSINYTNF